MQNARLESIGIRLIKFKKDSETLFKENGEMKASLQNKVKESEERLSKANEFEKKSNYFEKESADQKKEVLESRRLEEQAKRELAQGKE